MNDNDDLLQSLKGVAHRLQLLSQRAVGEYAPLVDQIVRTQSRDIRHIEHTRDGLLDFCGYEPALRLFKTLCRYYWELDPVGTAGYINAYRDLFEPDWASPGQRHCGS